MQCLMYTRASKSDQIAAYIVLKTTQAVLNAVKVQPLQLPTDISYYQFIHPIFYILWSLIRVPLIMNEFCFRPKKKMNEFWLRHVHWSLCWEIGGAGMFGSMTSHIQVHVLSRQVSSCSWIISFWSYNKYWQWFSIVLPRLPDNKRRKISVGWMIKLTLPWDSYPLRGCHVYWVGLLVGSIHV